MIQKVKEILRDKNKSFYWLSKQTGIPTSTLGNYVNGAEVPWKNACKIADALNVKLDDLREDN
ncbi:helix-turn-helix transcriptional regulator [Lactobacillus sp. PV037]|uniref:helix-turn-helix domain-containing protein n=1 Tax=Lactobacillus sp. PV037 TaxID=2594496 RepID=UPI00223F9CF1|nr:helix-turn-helix transcriptional regulator [Lactobacillus sp. PV037]QNQ83806.1 helix-turn-helix transcriptional regulator [Lactobacillus sp. PV037]